MGIYAKNPKRAIKRLIRAGKDTQNMKAILNYCIAYHENGKDHDEIYFSKLSLVKAYIDLLGSRRDISSLKCYQWEGKKNPTRKDITSAINLFLYR